MLGCGGIFNMYTIFRVAPDIYLHVLDHIGNMWSSGICPLELCFSDSN